MAEVYTCIVDIKHALSGVGVKRDGNALADYICGHSLKGHGHNVSVFLRESVNSVGVVNCTCKRQDFILNTTPSRSRLIIRVRNQYLDPNIVTVALEALLLICGDVLNERVRKCSHVQ